MTTARPRILGVIGLAGALFWLALNTVLSPDWGPPGSGNYLGYETINRLWSPAFAAMLAGYLGLFARYPPLGGLGRAAQIAIVGGLAAMIVGNVAEFWFFTDLSYGEWNARSLAWMLVLLGMLSLLIGGALLGLLGFRQRHWPAWASALLLLALPVTLGLVFTGQSLMFIAVPFVAALAAALALGLGAAHSAPAAPG